jgi:hypothetical protein
MPTKSRKPAATQSKPITPTSPKPDSPAIARPYDRFIVDQILPKFETHLVGGPSHSGKTTLIFQMIEHWRTGKDVFGHQSFPLPFCYLACECASGTVRSTLKRVGIDPSTFPFVSTIEHEGVDSFHTALGLGRRYYPDTQVLFIDGIHRLCGGKTNDDTNVSNFLASVNRELEDLSLTVVGIGNSTKVKGEEKFLNPRERFRGSGAWGTGTRTMIMVERSRSDELTNPKRTVMVIPSNAPDQVLGYSLDTCGLFQPDIEEPSRFEEYAEIITCHGPGTEFTRTKLLELATCVGDEGIPERSVNLYIKKLVNEGRMARTNWGRYQLPLHQ